VRRWRLPGISARIVDEHGNRLAPGTAHGEQPSGYLVLDAPWPAMLRGIWGDRQRFVKIYWSRFADQGWYFAGDAARYDAASDAARYNAAGDIWVLVRTDDVMNVSGHRISTAEVESALVGHPGVAEAAVIGATGRVHRSGNLRVRRLTRRLHPARPDHRRVAGAGRQ
jgi:acetyl-CoA synthetase